MSVTWQRLAYANEVVLKSALDANTVLAAITDDTPTSVSLGPSTVLGRGASGNIAALPLSSAPGATSAVLATTLNGSLSLDDLAVDNMSLASLEGGAYFGRVGLSENQWSLSNYGDTWTQKATSLNWGPVAMSSDGKFQTAVVDGGYIWVSSDHGGTWAQKASSRSWMSVAMSSDGRVQAATADSGYIWVSYDYGETWAQKASSTTWRSITMSSDGRFQTAVVYLGYIWISSDYGATWAQKASSASWLSVSMNSDGRIQTAGMNGGYFWVSYDYGETWAQKGNSNIAARAVAMSSDGKFQTVAASGAGYLWVSTDYGATWVQRGSELAWWGVAVSSNGKIQVAVANGGYIWISTNYGSSWSQKGSSRSWWSVAMSSDGKVQTAVNHGGYIYVSYARSFTRGDIGVGGNAIIDGDTGLGVEVPTAKLDVAGNIRAVGLILALSGGNSVYLAGESGGYGGVFDGGDNQVAVSDQSSGFYYGNGALHIDGATGNIDAPTGDLTLTAGDVVMSSGALVDGVDVSELNTASTATTASFGDHIFGAHAGLPLSRYTWAWNNQNSATVSENGGFVALGADATGGGTIYGMRAREVAFDGSGDFSIVWRGVGTASTAGEYGMYVRDASSIVYDAYVDSTAIRYGSRTAVNATTRTVIGSLTQSTSAIAFIFLRIARSGTTITWSFSYDGWNWVDLANTATSSATMTYCGIFGENRTASGVVNSSHFNFTIDPEP